jgi:general secretion pathway protein C
MSLSNNLSNVLEQLSKLPQRKITQVVVFLLLSYIAYLFAQITWLAMPQHSNVSILKASGSHSTQRSVPKTMNVKAVEALNLFGSYSQQAVEKVEEYIIEDAPETRLKLVLTGVVASSDKPTAAAIIESAGKQETYSIGESIKGTRAVLENVFNDRVLLKVSGRLETLMIDGVDFNKTVKAIKPSIRSEKETDNRAPSKRFSSPNIVDQRSNKSLTQSTKSLRKDLDADPGKITDYLKISPKRESGKITGYRLMPGKDPTFFQNAGLMTGDVAIQMNGFDLTAPREAAQALQSLKTEREISLLLNRNGEMTEILFSIDN